MKPRHLRHAAAMFVLASFGGGCLGCYAWMARGIARKSVGEHALERTGAAPPPLITLPTSAPSASAPSASAPSASAPSAPAPAASPPSSSR